MFIMLPNLQSPVKCFVDQFSCGHCMFSPSIHGIWLPLWCLAFLTMFNDTELYSERALHYIKVRPDLLRLLVLWKQTITMDCTIELTGIKTNYIIDWLLHNIISTLSMHWILAETTVDQSTMIKSRTSDNTIWHAMSKYNEYVIRILSLFDGIIFVVHLFWHIRSFPVLEYLFFLHLSSY